MIGIFLPPGMWALSVSVLVSYHLFLAWLLITADHEVGFSLPIFSTTLTHLACVTLILALAFGRHVIPFYSIIRYCIPALAPFERAWLFSGGKKKMEVPVTAPSVAAADVAAATATATGEDYEAWNHHLAHRNPLSRKPGTTLKDEYEQFMVARVKNRPSVSSDNSPA